MGNPRGAGKGRPGGDRRGGEEELHAAARGGDLRTVESICNSNPLAVNSRDRHSRTPLHLAAWSGQAEVVSYLCKHKADVGAAAMDDTAAIHFAAQKGHLEVARVLLASGASAKAANRKGMTPLHYAAQGSHLELVKYLVRKGANLGTKTKGGQTPLHVAESDDVRAFLKECGQSSKNGDESKFAEKGKELGSESSDEDGEIGSEPPVNGAGGGTDGNGKRKGEETAEPSMSEPKRAKVSLQHLTAEDFQDGEE